MKLKSIFFVLLAAIAFSSCSVSQGESTCPQIIGIGATDVIGPTTAAVNETITLNVTFEKSTCATFSSFYEATEGDAKVITVNASYDACSCETADVVDETRPYTFNKAVAGVYILKFKITDTTYITHTITVS